MSNIKKESIVFSCRLGGVLDYCIEEAVNYACSENIVVELLHNDRKFIIDPRKIYFSIRQQHE